jgi:hypothetical protein
MIGNMVNGNIGAPNPLKSYMAITSTTTPFINTYPFDSASGFGTKISNPASLPVSAGSGVAINSTGTAIVMGANSTPFIQGYPFSSTGYGTKFSNPATLPAALAQGIGMTAAGDAVLVNHTTTPFVSGYPFNASTGYGTKFSNPASLPTQGSGHNVAFNSAGTSVAIPSGSGTPVKDIQAYPWNSSTGFGTKYTDPTTGLGTGLQAAFNPAGTALAMTGGSAGPFIIVWAWNSSTGFGTKFSNPATATGNNCEGVAFSPAGDAISTVSQTPFINTYQWSGSGFGTKYSAPASPPTSSYNSVSWNTAGNVIAMTLGTTSPYVAAWPWTYAGGYGTRYSNPASLPPDGQYLAFI